jgi:hypothetical protein
MQRRRTRSLIAASLAGALALAACGSDKKTSDTAAPAGTTATAATTAPAETTAPAATTAPAETTGGTTAPSGAAGALKDVCPATVVIQTDWNPEGEHGFLYNMIGTD